MGRIEEYIEQTRKAPLEGVLTRKMSSCYKDDALNLSGQVLPYGLAVVWDDPLGGIALPRETGQRFKGIIFRSDIYEEEEREYGGGIILPGYPAGQVRFNYIASGIIPVFIDTAFTPNDNLFFRHTANGAGKEVVGRFSTSADGGTCDAVPNSEILNSGDAGTIANIRLGG